VLLHARTKPGRGLQHILLARLLERAQVRPAGRAAAAAARVRRGGPLRRRRASRPELVINVDLQPYMQAQRGAVSSCGHPALAARNLMSAQVSGSACRCAGGCRHSRASASALTARACGMHRGWPAPRRRVSPSAGRACRVDRPGSALSSRVQQSAAERCPCCDATSSQHV